MFHFFLTRGLKLSMVIGNDFPWHNIELSCYVCRDVSIFNFGKNILHCSCDFTNYCLIIHRFEKENMFQRESFFQSTPSPGNFSIKQTISPSFFCEKEFHDMLDHKVQPNYMQQIIVSLHFYSL